MTKAVLHNQNRSVLTSSLSVVSEKLSKSFSYCISIHTHQANITHHCTHNLIKGFQDLENFQIMILSIFHSETNVEILTLFFYFVSLPNPLINIY